MLKWSLAFDNFALVFDAIEALPYASAMAHKRVCLKVACKHVGTLALRPNSCCAYAFGFRQVFH
jgi:hypothetical protein